MLLEAVDNRIPLQDWLIHGGSETLDSYGKNAALSAVPKKHLDFISSWGDYHETDEYFYAHGNYLAELPLAEQPWGRNALAIYKVLHPPATQIR